MQNDTITLPNINMAADKDKRRLTFRMPQQCHPTSVSVSTNTGWTASKNSTTLSPSTKPA
eukprot:3715068-Ditylum_brightwellii.AAC.1